MNCALSGEICEEPVVSLKSGHVFERRLIEKYLEQTGTCPVTKQDLAKSDLLPLQHGSVSRPRVAAQASVPSVLRLLQTEWDALVLETFTLKQHLNTTREELARVMYQHDAACRVIARLIKERDAARAALTDVQKNAAAAGERASESGSSGAMDVEENSGLSAAIVSKMEETAQQLSAPRKKRVKDLAAAVTPAAKISSFTATSSHSLHSPSQPGVNCLDIHSQQHHMILTGGADSSAILFNRNTGKIEDTLKAHKKKVTDVKFRPGSNVDLVYTTSQDNSTCIWKRTDDKFSVAHTMQDHKDAVVGCSVHPSGDYLLTASADSSWNFYDARSGQLHLSVADEQASGYTCVEFHPDGLIFGAGAKDNVVRIFDVKQQKNVCSFSDGHSKGISAISFSENGYYLATADGAGVVKLWDLRKLSEFHKITLDDGSANALHFDLSGSYLAVGGNDVRVFSTKPWELVATFADHTAPVTGVRFGVNASFIASTSKDRSLKIFA